MIQRTEIIEQISSFPPLLPSVVRVMEWVGNPDREKSVLVQGIEKDTQFCWDIMLLANSSFFNRSATLNSLEEFVDRMDKASIYSIAVVVGSLRWFQTFDVVTKITPLRLWEHNLAVAVGVLELSSTLEVVPANHFFATGFLHDIGKAVMEKVFVVDSLAIIQEAEKKSISVDEAERRLLGIDHMEIGASILQRWGFPQEMVDAVRWHHVPDTFSGDHVLLDLVHVADAIALMMGIGPHSEGLNYQTSAEVNARLKLKISKIEEVIFRIQEKLESLRGPFAPLIGEKD
jgi:putative nucleotidyltransferase with HDIG domain